jgi:hypothetical protein
MGLWSPFTLDKEFAGSLPHAWQVAMPTFVVVDVVDPVAFAFPFSFAFACDVIRPIRIESLLNLYCL